jgi:hypothetical protein
MTPGTTGEKNLPAVVTVPCFSGAPWDLDALTPLSDLPLRTISTLRFFIALDLYPLLRSGN